MKHSELPHSNVLAITNILLRITGSWSVNDRKSLRD